MRSTPDGADARADAGTREELHTATATPASETNEGHGPHRRGFLARHRRAAGSLLLGAASVGFLYYVLPQIVSLGPTLERLRAGNPWWLALGVPLEALSLASYMAVFRSVFSRGATRIGWRASYQITMAGGGATKLFAAAGSGGMAVAVWALRAAGLSTDTLAEEMMSFEFINYGVYMAALVIAGFGLWAGAFTGHAPFALTLLPALLALGLIVLALSMRWLAEPVEEFMLRRAERSHRRVARWWRRGATVPRTLREGLRCAMQTARGPDRSWLAAIPAWGFDIAVLWASFRAFGDAPPVAVLIMGYYVGTLGSALPLPAGIGGVEGGMIGAFLGFGVNGSLAVLAVLAYRTISYWLPFLPESIGYVQLRHTVGRWRGQAASPPARQPVDPGRGNDDGSS
ncbi:MAG TPA: lysylphosphatidylglycerol synthase transmembrane domain-containing protein [Solirubrobacteraceae bacterium]|nr:lysylphosphatidylglycerol synthase transmembrane domain-containing protein [Solirubrobacteraceae bacterium]